MKKITLLAVMLICFISTSLSYAVDYYTIPTAAINIDGNFDDWNGIPTAIQDLTNDVYNASYIDIDKIYLAQDQDYFYFRIDVM